MSTQNNNLVRTLSGKESETAITSDRQVNALNSIIAEKEKEIHKLEHKLNIMAESKKRATSQFRRLRTHNEEDKSDIDIKSSLSTKVVPDIPTLLEKPKPKNRRANYKKKVKCESHCDERSLQLMFDEEPDPEPTPFLEVNGIVSDLPKMRSPSKL